MTIAAIIVAAGRGTRAGGDLPKQWQPLRGQAVVMHSLQTFATLPQIKRIVLVLHPDDLELARALVPASVTLVTGGASRDQSVRNALEALTDQAISRVLIHDGARPLVTHDLITRVIDALSTAQAAAPALPITDALWRGENMAVTGTAPRDGLWRAQTPQGFDFETILQAHRSHHTTDGQAADDVEVARAAGVDVRIVQGDERNIKVTWPGDFARAAKILQRDAMDIRTGNGFDVHRFCAGDHVWLCGVKIPYARGLDGHSDADVGMHALTDAIYGALAEGDIGRHFPPSDPQWKGADSQIFLKHAVDRVAARGFAISNVDVTLICEQPKIGPHAAAMCAALAQIMGLEIGRISVKATTSERLGFTGREEGIAALATATIVSA